MKLNYSKLSEEQTQKLLEHFIAGTPARTVANLLELNKNTATLFYKKIRQIIFNKLSAENKCKDIFNIQWKFYFDLLNNTEKEKAPLKDPLFGIIESQKKIYTFLLEKGTLQTQSFKDSSKLLLPHAIVYSPFPRKEGVINVNYLAPYRLESSTPIDLTQKRYPINRVEAFWKLMKTHLLRFNGVSTQTFPFFLKEAEWRYNVGEPKILLKMLLSWIIK